MAITKRCKIVCGVVLGVVVIAVSAWLTLSSGGASQEAMKKDYAQEIEAQSQTINSAEATPREIFGALIKREALHKKSDRFDLALQDTTQLIVMMPENPDLFAERAAIHNVLGNYKDAVDDYTKALSATSLRQEDETRMHVERGAVYLSLNDMDKAKADFDAALSLAADDVQAFDAKLNVTVASGKLDQALADLDNILKKNPKDAGWFLGRGTVNFHKGRMKEAQDDIKTSIDLDRTHEQAYLWQYLVELKAGQDALAGLKANLSAHKTKEWPAPLLAYFAGESSEADVFAEAQKGFTDERRGYICEANFYIGLLHVLKGAPDKGTPMVEKAAQQCPPRFIEWGAARAQLRAKGN